MVEGSREQAGVHLLEHVVELVDGFFEECRAHLTTLPTTSDAPTNHTRTRNCVLRGLVTKPYVAKRIV